MEGNICFFEEVFTSVARSASGAQFPVAAA